MHWERRPLGGLQTAPGRNVDDDDHHHSTTSSTEVSVAASVPALAKVRHRVVDFSSPETLRDTLNQQPLEMFCARTLPGLLTRLLHWVGNNAARRLQIGACLDAILLAPVSVSHPLYGVKSCQEFLANVTMHHESRTGRCQDICGYFFQPNDLAFNCRTCQHDDTCVQCIQCFDQSNHDGHEVYFHKTIPGGMCDCGDPEAWRPDGFCVHHRGGSMDWTDDDNPSRQRATGTPQVTQEMLVVARILFHEIVRVCVDLAKKSMHAFDPERAAMDAQNLLSKLQHDDQVPTQFHVRIHNDDVHSDEELVSSLSQKHIADAKRLVREIDSKGSAVVFTTLQPREAFALLNELQNEAWHACVVSDFHIQQEHALIQVIQWLKTICSFSTRLHVVFCEELFSLQNEACAPKEPISVLFLADPYLRKELVLELYQLYLNLQRNRELKRRFSLVFMNVYSRLMGRFFCGIGTSRESLFHYGVQIFTTPSVVRHLAQVGLLETLFGALCEALDMAKISCVKYLSQTVPMGHQVAFAIKSNYQVIDPNHALIKFARYHFVVSNLVYVLTMPEMVQQRVLLRTENLCKWFCCLLQLQGLHVQLRIQEGQEHVAYEQQTYASAFNLRVSITRLAVAIAKSLRKSNNGRVLGSRIQSQAIRGDAKSGVVSLAEEQAKALDETQVLDRVVENFMTHFWHHLKLFCDAVPIEFHVPPQSFLFSRPPVAVVRYDLLTQPVSFHYPLHEQFGWFLMELIYSRYTRVNRFTDWKAFFEQSVKDYGQQDAMDLIWSLLEYPLRALTFSSQIQSGFWVRNGNNMKRQMELYLLSHREGHDCRDVDVVLIQFCSLVLGFETFSCGFFDRCGLLPWIFGPNAETVPGLASDKRIPMLEESLLKLISLVTDVPMCVDSLTNDDALLRREIVHRLAYRPSSHSELFDLTEYVLLTPEGRMGGEKLGDDFGRLQRILDHVAIPVSKRTTGAYGNSASAGASASGTASGTHTNTTYSAHGDLKDTVHTGNSDSQVQAEPANAKAHCEPKLSYRQDRHTLMPTFEFDDDTNLEPTKYDITKEAFADEYDPCFCHLSRPEHEKAQIRRQEVLFRTWKATDPPIPLVAQLPRAHSAFAKIRLILVEKGLLAIVRVLLEDATLRHPKKTSVLVVMRVLHLLNLLVLVLKEEKDLMPPSLHQEILCKLRSGRDMFEESSLRREGKRQKQHHEERVRGCTGGGSDFCRSSNDHSSSACREVCEQSVLELLVILVKEQSKNDFQSLKPSISVIYWILRELSAMDKVVLDFVKKELWEPQNDDKGNETGMTMAERKRLHQQRAIQAIQARQKAFAKNHLSRLDLEDDDEEVDDDQLCESEHGLKPLPAPDCIICSRVDDADSIMYIGHVQTSQVTSHALTGKPCSNYENGFARPQMFLQLCGHAVHLNCWRNYLNSINESARLGGEQSNITIAFNPQLGEFLCPLCQSLSSTLVPYVEPRRVACVEQSESEKQAMERVFQTTGDPSTIAEWLSTGLVNRLQSPWLPDGVQMSAQRRAMAQFGKSYKNAMDRFKSAEQVSVPIVLMTNAYQAHLIWSSISSTFYSKQLSGVSLAVCSLESTALEINSGNSNRHGPTPTCDRFSRLSGCSSSSSSPLRLASILNPPPPSLERRLALNLPGYLEQQIDNCFSSKDDFKMNCVFRATRLVPLLFDTNRSFLTAVRDPVMENLQLRLSRATWIKAVENDAPLVLGLPILSQDLMHLLVVVCGMLETKAEMLLNMRSFCVLHFAQVLISCSQLEEEDTDDETKCSRDEDTERSLELLMRMLCETSGVPILASGSPPTGRQLRCLFETSTLVFLRQVTLFCRAVFRGGEHDPDESLYANFVNTLHVSSTFESMRKQLGLPTVQQILHTPGLMEYLRQAALQLRTNAFGWVHSKVKSNYFAGFAQPLLQALEQQQHLHERTDWQQELLQSNLTWMPRLPIRQEESDPEHLQLRKRYHFASACLINMPRLYTELYVKYVGRKCALTGKVQENPAICLICAQVLCGGSDCCRKQGIGACTLHARTCGDGMGAFFLLKDCNVILVFGGRSCHFKTPPYVDMFGEEDLHLRRGRPLFLHTKRIKALLQLVASHQIASEVARIRRSSERYIRTNYY